METGLRKVDVRFFASLREALGTGQELLILPAQVLTAGDARAYLRQRGGAWADALAEGRAVRIAYNQEMTDAGKLLEDGGELAFFPPVTGG
jgi:sulfur-carrier protein